tara:strand:- start:111 stop:1043 length:933 start_codon:yes stop_codon:yes gene_type:complete
MSSTTILAVGIGFFVGCVLTYLFTNKKKNTNNDEVVNKMASALIPINDKLSNLNNLFNNSVKLGKAIERPLENWLDLAGYVKGKQFDTQVRTDEGVPDLVLFNAYGNKKLVIDSKLPSENYNKLKKELDDGNEKEAENYHKFLGIDVKKQIEQCTKYLEMEDSLDLVIMYIGVDSIFQYLVNNKFYESNSSKSKTLDLQEFAEEKKVIIVSPSLLFVILEHIDVVKENFKIIEAQEELKKLHESLIKSWETWSSTIDTVEESINKALEKFQKNEAGNVLYELKQYRNRRFNNLDSKINEMKLLLKKEQDS